MSDDNLPRERADAYEVARFLDQVARTPQRASRGDGRLVFAMDATASREAAWDRAAHIQHEMFDATRDVGSLTVQLAFFRGFGEFKVTDWLSNADAVHRLMGKVFCLAGQTQIEKVLKHVRNQASSEGVRALVYVGDCCEEDIDRLGQVAGELGVLGVPAFMFHEGPDPVAERAFRHIAKLTGGAYANFDAASADVLKRLLGAVAVFCAGGRPALDDYARREGGAVAQLTNQMADQKPDPSARRD